MAISIGKMINGIEQDLSRFVNDPLSIFDGIGLNKADQNRVSGIRNSLQPPSPPRITPGVGRPVAPGAAAPAAGGPVTININITVYPNGVVGVGTADANVGQPHAVEVPPPPDMRKQAAQSQAAQSMVQVQSVKPSPTTTRKVVKKKPIRPRR